MIRPAEHSDLPRVQEMAQAFGAACPLAQAFPVTPAKVAALMALTMQHGLVLVAESGQGAVEGMCAVLVLPHPLLDTQMGSVVAWWVDPAARGAHGVLLLRRATKWAFKAGASVMQVSVPVGMPEAEKVCAALGFAQSERSWTFRSGTWE